MAKKRFRTIDLFAGIGGIRLGFELTGRVSNVFSSEIDKNAAKTYQANYSDNPLCDITKVAEKDVPDHDILLGGFPCQAFSLMGKRRGFDEARGTLFFDIARIIKEKRPAAFMLENVKGLLSHDRGRTFEVIRNVIEKDLGYSFFWKVLSATDFGVPQKRERIYMVGLRDGGDFEFPSPVELKASVKDVLEKHVSAKYYLSTSYWETLKRHKERNAKKGNGFGYAILDPDGVSNTLVVGGSGRERNLVIDDSLLDRTPVTKIKGEICKENIRRLTPREMARLQGFPDTFKIPVADGPAWKQFGNSVCVPVINAIAGNLIACLDKQASKK